MPVMVVVMRVGVDMLDRAVGVLMLMLGGNQHHYGDQEEHGRRCLQGRHALAENRQRQP